MHCNHSELFDTTVTDSISPFLERLEEVQAAFGGARAPAGDVTTAGAVHRRSYGVRPVLGCLVPGLRAALL